MKMKILAYAAALSSLSLPVAASTFHLVVPLNRAVTPAPAPDPTTPPSITVSLVGAALPKAVVSQAYSESLRPYLSVTGDASFDPAVARWSVVAGALPAGLTLDPITGVLSGTPTASTATPANFTVRATYKGKDGQSAYSLAVDLHLEVSLAGATLPNATVNKAYNESLRTHLAVVGDPAYAPEAVRWSLAEGTLPAGLALDAATGAVAGTPTAKTTAPVSFKVQADYKGTTAIGTYQVEALNAAIQNFGAYRAWADGQVAKSCLDYRNPGAGYEYSGATGDGIYRVQPAGQPAGNVYCDMTRDGGGWTLVARIRAGSMGHKNTAAVGSLTSPAQAAVAKLSDAYINALTSEMYLVRMDTYGTKVYFKADKPFIATSTANANLPAKLNLANAWTPPLASPSAGSAGLNTWSDSLGKHQLTKTGSAIGEGLIYTHATCTTCYGVSGGSSSGGFAWAGPGDSGTMWVR